jgi:hypothetical protein
MVVRSFALLVLALAAACGREAKSSKTPSASTVPAIGGMPALTDVTTSDPRGEIFLSKGCPHCHSISTFGIKSPTEVGPDLAKAYADVQTRFGVKLNEFLNAPTGTMQMVLGSMITLTPAERDSIIHILSELNEEHPEHGEGSHK